MTEDDGRGVTWTDAASKTQTQHLLRCIMARCMSLTRFPKATPR